MIMFFRLIIENIVLISHAIPMSIYVAIEVLKMLQVHLILTDTDMNRDPGQETLADKKRNEADEEKRN